MIEAGGGTASVFEAGEVWWIDGDFFHKAHAYDDFAAPISLLDASASLRLGPIGLSLEVFNVLGARYATTELSFVSDWDPSDARSRLPARHTSAGAPRTFMATLELSL